MSERIHALAYQLFGKSSVDECDLHEIRSMTERFPYFAPARFLLLEKLKQTQAPEYSSQLQKAVLYYHNPLEFEQFISSDRFYTDVNLEKEIRAEQALTPEPEARSSRPSYETLVAAEPLPATEERVKEENDLSIEERVTEPATLSDEELVEAVTQDEDLGIADEILESEEITEQEGTSAPPLELKAPENLREHRTIPEEKTDLIVFEPYHTVDYFASQGIRLSQEEASGTDKFGKQLKSFTEWLKTMKKLPKAEQTREQDTVPDAKVQHLAEDSVHDTDIVTEAMAEVWIKQGNTEKALEVYNKLSLLNPAKNAYFAGKIDHLKRS